MSSQSGPQRLSMSYKNQHFSNGGLGSDCRPRQVPIGTMARSTQKQSLSLIRAYSPHARVRVQVTLVTLLSPSRLPLVSSGGSFWAFLGPAGKMALRKPLGGHSEWLAYNSEDENSGPPRLSMSYKNQHFSNGERPQRSCWPSPKSSFLT